MLENYLTLRNESAMPSSENFISRNYAPGWELSAYNTLGIFGGFASGFSFQFLGTIPSFLLAVTPNLVSMISDDDTVKGVIKSDGGSMIFNALLVTGATAAGVATRLAVDYLSSPKLLPETLPDPLPQPLTKPLQEKQPSALEEKIDFIAENIRAKENVVLSNLKKMPSNLIRVAAKGVCAIPNIIYAGLLGIGAYAMSPSVANAITGVNPDASSSSDHITQIASAIGAVAGYTYKPFNHWLPLTALIAGPAYHVYRAYHESGASSAFENSVEAMAGLASFYFISRGVHKLKDMVSSHIIESDTSA